MEQLGLKFLNAIQNFQCYFKTEEEETKQEFG